MSLGVFQPISIQLMQQSLNLTFDQAVASLGINKVFLTYARSGVAVFLGAILAITNAADETAPVKSVAVRRHRFACLKQFWQWIRAIGQKQPKPAAPVTVNQELPAQVATPQALDALSVAPAVEPEAPTQPLVPAEEVAVEQIAVPELPRYDTPEQRAQRVSEIDFTDLSARKHVAKVLELFPDLSDRELGKLSGIAAAPAKKYRETLKLTPSSTPSGQAHVTEESSQ
jgi:hypothetical protein